MYFCPVLPIKHFQMLCILYIIKRNMGVLLGLTQLDYLRTRHNFEYSVPTSINTRILMQTGLCPTHLHSLLDGQDTASTGFWSFP